MHTVAEALRRDRPLFAAPGSVRSPTSAGTNRLLRDGAQVLCDVSDVLLALGLTSALRRSADDDRPPPSPQDAKVLDAIGWSPVGLATIADRLTLPLGELALALDRLCRQGWLAEDCGWFERVARPEK